MRRRRTASLLVALLGVGCGHAVDPRGIYTTPESIPLPGNLQAFFFSGVVQLTWENEDAIFAVIDGWYVYRAEGPSPGDADYVRLNRELVRERVYVDPDVEEGREYAYRLTSVSASGLESVPTFAVPVRVDLTPPGSPTGVSALYTAGKVRIEWSPPADEDLGEFRVYRDPESFEFPLFIGDPMVTSAFDNFPGTAGDTLRYWVTAVDRSLNESAPSETALVIVPAF